MKAETAKQVDFRFCESGKQHNNQVKNIILHIIKSDKESNKHDEKATEQYCWVCCIISKQVALE